MRGAGKGLGGSEFREEETKIGTNEVLEEVNMNHIWEWESKAGFFNDLNRHVTEEDMPVTDKHMESCLISLVTREMQSKTITYPTQVIEWLKLTGLTVLSAGEDVPCQELSSCIAGGGGGGGGGSVCVGGVKQ